MMRTHRTAAALILALVSAPGVFAQQADPRFSEEPQPVRWSITPRMTTSTAYDDNVLIQGKGEALSSDLNTALNPEATLAYVGKLSSLSASYTGSWQLYRDFSTLNSFDHFLNVSGRRRIRPHMLLFAQQSYSNTATTEVPALSGIPFVRIGARIADLRGGMEWQASKRLGMVGSYNFQWIAFDNDPLEGIPLFGGHSHGGTVGARYQIDTRTTMTVDYDLQLASIFEGTTFSIQNVWAGADYQLSEYSHVFGALGVARLDAPELGNGRTSPSWRGGYSHRFEALTADITYTRSFIPSYGNGGTLSNQDVTSSVHVPLGRRIYAEGSLAWRRNEALVGSEPPLTSVWAGGTIGYAVQPWMHIEGFYGGTHQNNDLPGGELGRNRFGIQVVTAKPVRIR
jgi:hypothetical protein